MASVSEHFIKNFSWKSWTQAKDLHKRILFTLGVFIVYRLGTYIPLPGINVEAMKDLAQQYEGQGILSMFNMVSGGALERMSIFALNLMPYISSSIIIQLMSAMFPYFIALKKEGESGKRKLTQYTRYGTIGLASFQALSLASLLKMSGGDVVYDIGFVFHLSTLITIVGATLFLMWLGEQITSRGLGNGSSMIIYAGILANLPRSVFETLEKSRVGGVSSYKVFLVFLLTMTIVTFIVFMEKAYRKVEIVTTTNNQVGRNAYTRRNSKDYMPLKLNPTGVLPVIFSAALLGFFKMLGNWSLLEKIPFIGKNLKLFLSGDGLWNIFLQVALIIFFSFFYTTIVFNPKEVSNNILKQGNYISEVGGARLYPGEVTEKFLAKTTNRLMVIGSIYIAFVVVLPSLFNYFFNLRFLFQGTSFLISVSVSLELIAQIHSYIMSHQYAPLLRRYENRKGKK